MFRQSGALAIFARKTNICAGGARTSTEPWAGASQKSHSTATKRSSQTRALLGVVPATLREIAGCAPPHGKCSGPTREPDGVTIPGELQPLCRKNASPAPPDASLSPGHKSNIRSLASHGQQSDPWATVGRRCPPRVWLEREGCAPHCLLRHSASARTSTDAAPDTRLGCALAAIACG